MRVLALGGGGLLGRALTPLLESQGHQVVIGSRSAGPQVDIVSGEGLAEAMEGTNVVVHLASNARKPRETDVQGTRNIVDRITSQHLIYMSIVGVDRHPLPYYRAKYEAEQVISDSVSRHTIFRATQFHDFIAFLLSKACRRWACFVPRGFVFQPVATGEVAAELARLVETGPGGLVPDLAGPEILPIETLARSYGTARGREAPLIRFPVLGKSGAAFREGAHTNPERASGNQTWLQYLEQL